MACDTAIIASQQRDPLRWARLGLQGSALDRLKTALGLFVAERPINELALRAASNGTKTQTKAFYVIACLQKRKEWDGVPLPQWRGPVEGIQSVLDYPQQLLSVKPAYLKAVGDWPHHWTYDGEYLKALRIMPIGGDPHDQGGWSRLYFGSQKNWQAGTGARFDIADLDEPARLDFLEELRKGAHSGRRSLILHGFTPTKMREWAPIRQDLGDTPRSSLKRIDQDRAECRWSLHEVADWVLPPERKAELVRKYKRSAIADARLHGDYTNAEGASAWGEGGLEILTAMAQDWCRAPVLKDYSVPVEGPGGKMVGSQRVQVQVWGECQETRLYYEDLDPAAGSEHGHPLAFHLSEIGSGDLQVRWNGRMAPFSVGVLAAAVASEYNEAFLDIEMNDKWGVNALRGAQAAQHKNFCYEQRELKPGKFSSEVGFGANGESRATWIGLVQQWMTSYSQGMPYARCPSREVFNCLIDCELDDRDKIIAGPGIDHGEDLVLLGQKLRRAVTRDRTLERPIKKAETPDDRTIRRMRGELQDIGPRVGRPGLVPKVRR